MTDSQFENPILLKNGDLKVFGPIKQPPPRQELIGDITIRFLIIQQTAKQGGQPVIIDHVASWTSGPRFETTVPKAEVKEAEDKAGRRLRVGSKVRGIAMAILVRQYDQDPKVPPAIETFTWCVEKKLVRG
jgi:hypothetical protein